MLYCAGRAKSDTTRSVVRPIATRYHTTLAPALRFLRSGLRRDESLRLSIRVLLSKKEEEGSRRPTRQGENLERRKRDDTAIVGETGERSTRRSRAT